MKCMSCGSPIPPEFKSAIQNNLCPSCGGEIMNESTLELLDEIKTALETMPNDPAGIAGWLLSHYEMRKTGTGEPVGQFYGSKPQPTNTNPHYQQFLNKDSSMMDKEAALRSQPKVATNKLQQFYANAGVKPKTREGYAALAQQLQSEDNGVPNYDQEYDVYDQGGVPTEADDPEFTNAILNASTNGGMSMEDKIALQQMMGNLDSSQEEGYDPSLPPILNQQRIDRLRKQQEISNGGCGKIRRSE